MSLKYEPSSKPLHISANLLSLNGVACRARPCACTGLALHAACPWPPLNASLNRCARIYPSILNPRLLSTISFTRTSHENVLELMNYSDLACRARPSACGESRAACPWPPLNASLNRSFRIYPSILNPSFSSPTTLTRPSRKRVGVMSGELFGCGVQDKTMRLRRVSGGMPVASARSASRHVALS